jgi:hypothetical protein
MNKKHVVSIVIAAVILAGIYLASQFINPPKSSPVTPAKDIKNASYLIDNSYVTLVDGRSETAIPNSSDKIIFQYYGNEAVGDLNGDNIQDTAFILTETAGGSGTFYIVVAALGSGEGYKGTNSILLGDRIRPQSLEIQDGEIIVNYLDHGPGEPLASASLQASKRLQVKEGVLVQVGQ